MQFFDKFSSEHYAFLSIALTMNQLPVAGQWGKKNRDDTCLFEPINIFVLKQFVPSINQTIADHESVHENLPASHLEKKLAGAGLIMEPGVRVHRVA